jgi:hypothetical protein
MKLRWLFLGIVALGGILYVVGQFWQPSLKNEIIVLFLIFAWMLSHSEQQINDRLERIEAELRKKPPEIDWKLDSLQQHIDWRLDNLKIDLGNLEKSIEYQVSCSDPSKELDQVGRKLDEVIDRVTELGERD